MSINQLIFRNLKKNIRNYYLYVFALIFSVASRVVFIKDGQIYTQLNKGGQDRQMFFQDIMKTQGVLGGVQHEY
ncbi:hypothetical protein A943_14905 [Bacillus sp. CPSM8]|nr:hypothetical protein A943_14905 [Bacillus sp. CPSM8]